MSWLVSLVDLVRPRGQNVLPVGSMRHCSRLRTVVSAQLHAKVVRMDRLKPFVCTVLLALGTIAFAGGPTYQIVVSPAAPTAGQPIQIQVSIAANACTFLPSLLLAEDLGGNIIRFDLGGSDACVPNLPAQQQTYNVGGFPAGQYIFRFAECYINPPPGGDQCITISEQNVVIGAAESVPATADRGLAVLSLLLIACGVTAIRRRV